ncbi:MAG TPA: FAD:protein FMN transferase [Pirellulales bacterium]|nr:FAD:protein FMN transferase [Pirellulales bacterium]
MVHQRVNARMNPPTSILARLSLGRFSVALLVAVTTPSFATAQTNLQRYAYERVLMGAPVKLVLYAAVAPSANLAADAAYERIAELDRVLSDYKPDSELSRLSDKAGSGQAVAVGPDLWAVLARAQKLAEQTDGAFDVTVGPYTRLWRRARRNKEFPPAERLAEARLAVGYKKLKLDPAGHTAQLLAPSMRLDLGGIATGYAVDEAMKVLKAHGIERALIDASGDILVSEPPPGEAGWKIGIAPLDPAGPPSRYLSLRNTSVTTSGDAFQHVVLDGKRYSHIVDPATGLGLTDQSSVTVVAADCITADSVATAASVLGPTEGLKLVESTSAAAAFFVRQSEGRVETFASDRLEEHLFDGKPK